MFFITFLGIILRLFNISKPEGLWNDEYVSWYVASTPFNNGFCEEILKQCHAPLYYFYLKPFTGYSDNILRLTSVIPNVLAIIIMYYIGKEFSKKCAYFLGAMTSVLSFLIYYSQEVRFYSLLFLFSAISLLFTIRYLKNESKANLCGYILSNVLIISTHIIGFVFVFFNVLYVLYKKRKFNFSIISVFLAVTFLLLFFMGKSVYNMIPVSQWWGHFSYTNILFLLTDYFSPILTNHVNAPNVFFYNKNLSLWLILPTLFAVVGIISGIKNFKGYFAVSLSYLFVLAIASILGKMVFVTKYTIEILPILLLICAYGYCELKRIGIILFALFVSCHIFCAFTPYYVTLKPRNEGHKIVGDILNQQNSGTILFTYYAPERFARYTDYKNKKLKSISKINRYEMLENPSAIISDVKKSESISVVFLDSVSFLNEDFINKNVDNKNIPEMFVIFSKIRISLAKELVKNYKIEEIKKAGSWTVVKAVKN